MVRAAAGPSARMRFGVTLSNAAPRPVEVTLRLQVEHEEDLDQPPDHDDDDDDEEEDGDTGVVDGDDSAADTELGGDALGGPAEVVDLVLEEKVWVGACSVLDFQFSPTVMRAVRLWWPNGAADPAEDGPGPGGGGGCSGPGPAGRPRLYRLSVVAEVDGVLSDTEERWFGVRQLVSWVDPVTRGRVFAVNGRPIFVRGGNWICSDALFRFSHARTAAEVALHRQAGLNMIRCWGGEGCEREGFFRVYDREGILVWVELCITGDDNGRGSGTSQLPLNHDLWLACAEQLIRIARAHPCVAIYVGGNEQEPCDQLLTRLRAMLGRLDPDRSFVPGSLWDGKDECNACAYVYEYVRVCVWYLISASCVRQPLGRGLSIYLQIRMIHASNGGLQASKDVTSQVYI